MPTVHATAVVDPRAEIAEDARIGPFCVLTGPVNLGPGVRLISHVCIDGPATIGAGTIIYPNAALGFEPQDYKFKPGARTPGIVIGQNCIIREHATIHAATKPDRPTTVGDRVFLMVNAHVGHDARVHDDVILVNNVALGGHSEVFDKAILSANTAVHQFGRVGRLAMCSASSVVTNDVPPFCMAAGRNTLVGLNLIGMRRAGLGPDEINAVRQAYREVFRRNPQRTDLLARLAERGRTSPAVQLMHDFVVDCIRPITPVGGRRTRPSSNRPENDDA